MRAHRLLAAAVATATALALAACGGGSDETDEPAAGLANGSLDAAGDPAAVLTEACVRAAFGLGSQVTDPTSGKPLMLPLGRHHISAHM